MEKDLDSIRCELANAILAEDFGKLRKCAHRLIAKIQTLCDQLEWLQTEHARVVHQWCREETRHQDEITSMRAELDNMTKINQINETSQIIVDLDTITLTLSGNTTRENGVSLIEATAWYTGHPHTQNPPNVSTTLCVLGENLNNSLPHDHRQKLKTYIPSLIGTANDKLDPTRIRMTTDWLIRTCAPIWLKLIGFENQAKKLANLDQLTNETTTIIAKTAIYETMQLVADETGVKWAMVDDSLLSISSKIRLEEAIQLSTQWIAAKGDPRRAVIFFAWLTAIDKGPSALDQAITEIQNSAVQLYGDIINPAEEPVGHVNGWKTASKLRRIHKPTTADKVLG